MGCDLCVYVPAKEDHDCAMSYSTFDTIRVFVAADYLNEKGVEIDPESVGIGTYNRIVAQLKEYRDKGDSHARILCDWLNHSDCEGSYWPNECEDIVTALTHYLERFEGKWEDNWFKDRIECLIDTFKYAAENDGIVEVC